MRALRKSFIALLLVTLLVALAAADIGEAQEGCRRFPAGYTAWSQSAAFVGDRLVLADTSLGGLRSLAVRTGVWATHLYPGQGPLDFERVLLLGGGEGGVVSALERLVFLDAELRPTRGIELSLLAGSEGTAALLQGTMGPGQSVVGLLDVMSADGTFESGVAEVRLGEQRGYRYLRKVGREPGEFDFYAALTPFSARLGDRLFWLVMASPAHVLEATPEGGRKHDIVPSRWRQVPLFSSGGPGSTVQDYARRERQSFLAGLYALGKELYLLYRTPLPVGGASWQLAAVHPDQPTRSARILTLPTSAPWINLVAGPSEWAIIEKGSVTGQLPSEQRIESVLFLPNSWFTAPASPLTREPKKDLCP
jgi:hypothetical protein